MKINSVVELMNLKLKTRMNQVHIKGKTAKNESVPKILSLKILAKE